MNAPFGDRQRIPIMIGFVHGAIDAAAKVMAETSAPYLHWLQACACAGAQARTVLSAGEEKLHQLIHALLANYPRGEIPEKGIMGILPVTPGTPLEGLLRQAMDEEDEDEEESTPNTDLN
jgi:hypothetical protein